MSKTIRIILTVCASYWLCLLLRLLLRGDAELSDSISFLLYVAMAGFFVGVLFISYIFKNKVEFQKFLNLMALIPIIITGAILFLTIITAVRVLLTNS